MPLNGTPITRPHNFGDDPITEPVNFGNPIPFELENGSGVIALESGTGVLLLE